MDTQGRSGSSSGPTPTSSTNPPQSPLPPQSSGGGGSGGSSTRGAVASLACDVCRRKKIKCDEGLPRCGNCTKNNLDCQYRETQPTKKDKTLVEIKEILLRIEKTQQQQGNLLSDLKPGQGSDSGKKVAGATDGAKFKIPDSPRASMSSQQASGGSISATRGPRQPAQHRPSLGGRISQPYRHTSAAHKMLTWPAIQELLTDAGISSRADLETLSLEGSAFIIRMCKEMTNLPLEDVVMQQPFVGVQTMENRLSGGSRVVFSYLTPELMERLAEVYFNTFNMLYPFMDREAFMDKIPMLKDQGFDSDTLSVTALLIFALGELAEDCLQQNSTQYGQTGTGSVERYPGIKLFNEARKRIGFVLTECELENVQIFSLAALFLESCSYHVEFWRMAVSASSACQVLVTCKPIDWESSYGDLVKRAYWHCAILETGLHLELDLPMTGLLDLRDRPPSVAFAHERSEADDIANEVSHYRAHHASQLSLRRLCADLHDEINESMGTALRRGKTSEGFGGPTAKTLANLEGRLREWRGLLPRALQWPEDDPTVFSENIDTGRNPDNLDPALGEVPKLFYVHPQPDQNFPYVYDIQVALLRTRYYYAKYMVYRPYIYKALHFPEELTPHDIESVVIGLKSCIKWPITMYPTASHKRLIPYLFCWSQNLLGIILILRLSERSQTLWKIREEHCGGKGSGFEQDVNQSIQLMLDWILDLKDSCPITRWCYDILRPLYDLKE